MDSFPGTRWPALFAGLATRWKLRGCERVGLGTRARGRIWIHGRGAIRIGADVVLDGSHHPIELHALEAGSEVVLGDGVHVAGGTSIEAVQSVRVGPRTRLGPFAKLMDNHFHALVGSRHSRPPSSPVIIGQDVEIGARAILLAGAEVGDGATIGPGTVLTRRDRVAAGRKASGSPAVVE
jgi:maltose O-acetyltransferase